MAQESVFVLTAHRGSGHGDTAGVLLVDRDFDGVLKAIKDLPRLGYKEKFFHDTHGVSLELLEIGKAYPRQAFTSIDGLPVPYGFPVMAFFRWQPGTGTFKVEWYPSVFRRAGVELPPQLLEGALSLEG